MTVRWGRASPSAPANYHLIMSVKWPHIRVSAPHFKGKIIVNLSNGDAEKPFNTPQRDSTSDTLDGVGMLANKGFIIKSP